MDDFNNLIVLLMAIEGKAKDIHYTCSGADFYGKHLFADRIADGISDFIDQIKETCLLGKGDKPLLASEYYTLASKIYEQDDRLINNEPTFMSMHNLILACLVHIEEIQDVSRGDSKLLDDIANKLQNDKGLIKIMIGDI